MVHTGFIKAFSLKTMKGFLKCSVEQRGTADLGGIILHRFVTVHIICNFMLYSFKKKKMLMRAAVALGKRGGPAHMCCGFKHLNK